MSGIEKGGVMLFWLSRNLLSPALALYVVAGLFMPSAQAAPPFFRPVNISPSPNPLGAGARALGMGSAFIGVADDATAASWNPAGLIQLETPELSIVGSSLSRHEVYSSISYPEASGPQQNTSTTLNYFSAAIPIQLPWTNAVFSLNYQELYDFNKSLDFNFAIQGSEPTPIGIPLVWDFTQQNHYRRKGGLYALSPAMAVQITPHLSIGATLNWWTDRLGLKNGWQQETTSVFTGGVGLGSLPPPSSQTRVQRESYDHLNGVNFNFGLLWEVNEKLRLGVVAKTPFNLRMKHHLNMAWTGDTTGVSQFDEDAWMHFPLSYGAGMAIRFSDAFTIAMDVFRTEWPDFFIQSQNGVPLSPLDGLPLNQSRVKTTQQIRLGGEYLMILPKTVFPIRGGLYYDPQPSPAGIDKVYGISVGTGYMHDNLVFDLAYTFDWGSSLNGDASGISGSRFNLKRQRVYASCIVHF